MTKAHTVTGCLPPDEIGLMAKEWGNQSWARINVQYTGVVSFPLTSVLTSVFFRFCLQVYLVWGPLESAEY
jgi:hypothetical protein